MLGENMRNNVQKRDDDGDFMVMTGWAGLNGLSGNFFGQM